jgi:hypothetical protein
MRRCTRPSRSNVPLNVRLRSPAIVRLASGAFELRLARLKKAHILRCVPMDSLDVQKEYACAQPVLSKVEGSILARVAPGPF